MWRHNFLTYGGKIAAQLVGEILYFPIWWYSVGFFRLLKNSWRFLGREEDSLGFSIWAKNIFVPMYGQNDWAGRIISFFVRLVQVIVRGFLLLLVIAWLLFIVLLWLFLPIFLLLALALQISQ